MSTVSAPAFPFHRDHWKVGDVLSFAWKVFTREWAMLSLSMLMVVIAAATTNLFTQRALAATAAQFVEGSALPGLIKQALSWVVGTAGSLGMLRVALAAIEGRPVRPWNVAGGLAALPRYLPAAIASSAATYGLIVGLFALAGFVPSLGLMDALLRPFLVFALAAGLVGAAVVVPSVIALFEAARGASTIETVVNALRFANGQRLRMLGVALLSGLISIGGVFALCVGIVPAGAFVFVLLAVAGKAAGGASTEVVVEAQPLITA